MTTFAFPTNGQSARGASIAALSGDVVIPDWRQPRLASYDLSTQDFSFTSLGVVDTLASVGAPASDFYDGIPFAGQESFDFDSAALTGSYFALTDNGTDSISNPLETYWIAQQSTQETGFSAAVVDTANDILWMTGYGERLVGYSSSGTVGYALPFNSPFQQARTFCGVALNGSTPLLLSYSGEVYAASGGITQRMSPDLGAPCNALASLTTGGYAALSPSTAQVIPFTISTPSTLSVGTAISTPMSTPYAMAAGASGTSGLIGVVGTNDFSLSIAASGGAYISLTSEAFATQPAAGTVSVLKKNSVGDWAVTQTVTTSGDPTYMAALPNAEQILVTFPSSGQVQVIPETDGVWGSGTTQTFDFTDPGQIVNAGNSSALFCQPSANQVTPLYNNGTGTWSSGTAIPLPGATALVLSSDTAGYAGGSSGSSGIIGLSLLNGAWEASGSISVNFDVTSLAVDTVGGLYACGTSGSVGYLEVYFSGVAVGGTSWTGGASAIAWYEGQIAVLDPVNNLIRTFGLINGQYQQVNSYAAPSGANLFMSLPQTWFLGGSALWEMNWGAPYVLERTQTAVAAVYNQSSSTWAQAALGRGQRSFATTFDSSGLWYIATDANVLWVIEPDGSISSQTTIPVYSGQQQTTPLGLSGLLWDGGTLYGSSCLNNALAVGI